MNIMPPGGVRCMDRGLFTRRRGRYNLESSYPQTCIYPARWATRVCLPESIREWQGGVGRRNGRLHRWVRTPPRKIRTQFHGYKHTSLIRSVGVFSEVRMQNAAGNITGK